MMSNLTEDSYVRCLRPHQRNSLCRKLNNGDLWERLAGVIPNDNDFWYQNANSDYKLRFKTEDIMQFRLSANQTESVLKHWVISNCRIKHLVKALLDTRLYEAANYVLQEVLHMEPFFPLPALANDQHSQFVNPLPDIQNVDPGLDIQDVDPGTGKQDVDPGTGKQDVDPGYENKDKSDVDVNRNNNVSKLQDAFAESFKVRKPPEEQDETSMDSDADSCDTLKPEESNDLSTDKTNGQISNVATVGSSGTHGRSNDQDQNAGRVPEEVPDDPILKYQLLGDITENFNDGRLIGTGGFGDVYLGIFHNGFKVAIKRLRNNTSEDRRQFDTEIETLRDYRHENLVTLLAYSIDGERNCLVYQYMPNGSLEDRLACESDTPPLSVAMRVEIARGTARGIKYLHSMGITHRDIKSANILLDAEYKPKVGDFATAKVAPITMKENIKSTIIMQASVVIGTQPYLAPEATDFQIHNGLDVFSFGVVLLELITGLKVSDPNREERDLKLHVLEHCSDYEDDEGHTVKGNIYDLRDQKVPGWNRTLVENLHKLSQSCLEPLRRHRCKIDKVLEKLQLVYEA